MSDSSGPHRLEELESKVENMMDIMSQLLEAKSAGGGQQREEEESGGTAHNYSGGAGRASPTADTGYGVTEVGAAAAAEVLLHSRRAASKPTRPADDIGRRPEVPAGGGSTINTYSGEASESYLAGIAGHDGGSTGLNPSFHGQSYVIPPVLKGGKGFQTFKHDFFLKANMLDISDHFVGQRVRAVPVGDPLKQKAVLLREGLLPEEIRGAYQAWNFMDTALQSEEGRAIPKQCRSPREVFKFIGKWYDAENEVATEHLFDKFHEFSIPQNSNHIAALHAFEVINNQMGEKGMGEIPDTVLHARFAHALSAEYDHAKETLQSRKKTGQGRDHSRGQHAVLQPTPQKRGAKRSSRPSEHAFFSSESGDRRDARPGRGRNHGGGQGSSSGGNSSSEGGRSSSGSASGNTGGFQGSSRGSNGASNCGSGSDGGSCNTPPGRCWCCREGATRERRAPRKRAILYLGALGAQVWPRKECLPIRRDDTGNGAARR